MKEGAFWIPYPKLLADIRVIEFVRVNRDIKSKEE